MKIGASNFINIKNIQTELSTKIDVIVDTTGNTDAISSTIPYLSDKGRYVLVGQPKPGQIMNIPNANSLFGGNGKIIKATQGGKTSPNEDIARYVKLHKAGMLNIDDIITHEFSLDEINTAVETLRSGIAGRIMVRMNHLNG